MRYKGFEILSSLVEIDGLGHETEQADKEASRRDNTHIWNISCGLRGTTR